MMIAFPVRIAAFSALTALMCLSAVNPAEAEKAIGYNGKVEVISQGWDEHDRATFYHAAQGSPILPYSYFFALEEAASGEIFSSRKNLSSFGLIYWKKSANNPDNLPVGLTDDLDISGTERFLGMNCAACHVTEIKVGNQKVLIDGGTSHFDFYKFMRDLTLALQKNYSDDEKFDRFARRVLKDNYSATHAVNLRARLRGVMRKREDWLFRNKTAVNAGPGRVDALNVILNQVSAKMLHRPDNARVVDAPVSFPYLWDAPYLDFVQYNGVVPNKGAGALGRNVGQVLGVFGEVALQESSIPGGYASSVNVQHLLDLEETLKTLKSPRWSELAEKKLLPEIDRILADKGRDIYDKKCSGCHQVIDRDNRGDIASIKVKLLSLPEIGTDSAAALGFVDRVVASGPLKGRKEAYSVGQPMCEHVHGNSVLAHVTVGVIMSDLATTYKPVLSTLSSVMASGFRGLLHESGNKIRSLLGLSGAASHKHVMSDTDLIAKLRAKGISEAGIVAALQKRSDNSSALYDQLVSDSMEYHGKDKACLEVLAEAQYRARPLNGIWATGPYLHNGSVMSLKDLLEPVNQRKVEFRVGDTEFRPDVVGFAEPSEGGFAIDTRLKGNSNHGHTYGTELQAAEKVELLEYLKSL